MDEFVHICQNNKVEYNGPVPRARTLCIIYYVRLLERHARQPISKVAATVYILINQSNMPMTHTPHPHPHPHTQPTTKFRLTHRQLCNCLNRHHPTLKLIPFVCFLLSISITGCTRNSIISIAREWADDLADEGQSSRERLRNIKKKIATTLPADNQATLR